MLFLQSSKLKSAYNKGDKLLNCISSRKMMNSACVAVVVIFRKTNDEKLWCFSIFTPTEDNYYKMGWL